MGKWTWTWVWILALIHTNHLTLAMIFKIAINIFQQECWGRCYNMRTQFTVSNQPQLLLIRIIHFSLYAYKNIIKGFIVRENRNLSSYIVSLDCCIFKIWDIYQALCKTKIAQSFKTQVLAALLFCCHLCFPREMIWIVQLVTIQNGAKMGGKVLTKQHIYLSSKHELWSLAQSVKTRECIHWLIVTLTVLTAVGRKNVSPRRRMWAWLEHKISHKYL